MLAVMRPGGPPSDASAAIQAAEALRHDLGRAIRFSAPEAPEASTDALRERLRADVVRTRHDPSGERSAARVFDDWRRRDGADIPAGDASETLTHLEGLVEEVRGLASRLDALDRAGLLRLDALTREVSDACRRLAAETARAEGAAK
jgi:hypothetical protein